MKYLNNINSLLGAFLIVLVAGCGKGQSNTTKTASSLQNLTQTVPPLSANPLFENIEKMGGCFLVDYNYSETESLKENYVIDERVYDVNKNKSVKEWIYPVIVSGTHIRLQHILFATDPSGKAIEGSFLKHQAEDWEFQPAYWYEFTKPGNWDVQTLSPEQSQGKWIRKITHLDDGLRYQCVAPFTKSEGGYAEWTCSNYAPIPGRETRDMGRKDYNTLGRTTKIIVYGDSWLERQDNIKTIYKDGVKTPLARETGKNWFVRLKDTECDEAKAWTQDKLPFWNLLREVWASVLDGKSSFTEATPAGRGPRFAEMMEIEQKYSNQSLLDAQTRTQAETEIRSLIQEYRKQ